VKTNALATNLRRLLDRPLAERQRQLPLEGGKLASEGGKQTAQGGKLAYHLGEKRPEIPAQQPPVSHSQDRETSVPVSGIDQSPVASLSTTEKLIKLAVSQRRMVMFRYLFCGIPQP
jgi:hypothetical protein